MSPSPDLPLSNVRAWLRQTGERSKRTDFDALDRIADLIMDALSVTGDGELQVVEKLTALRKVSAMLLAGILDEGERLASATGDAGLIAEGKGALDGICRTMGDALAVEVARFRRAHAKDMRALQMTERSA